MWGGIFGRFDQEKGNKHSENKKPMTGAGKNYPGENRKMSLQICAKQSEFVVQITRLKPVNASEIASPEVD